MRIFAAACAAAVVVALVGAFALSFFQEPVSAAFTTEAVRN